MIQRILRLWPSYLPPPPPIMGEPEGKGSRIPVPALLSPPLLSPAPPLLGAGGEGTRARAVIPRRNAARDRRVVGASGGSGVMGRDSSPGGRVPAAPTFY